LETNTGRNDYIPRDAFLDFHRRKVRFGVIVAHRRAGKTVACICDLILNAKKAPYSNARFSYIAPQYNQAKDIAWEYLKQYTIPMLNLDGKEEGIPKGTINESELKVTLPNGASIRLYGADNPSRLRGLYHDGVILDEYADMDARIWEVIRPSLSDRHGWCVWIGTPRGHNDFYNIYQRAIKENWYVSKLKATDTNILAKGEIEQAKHDLSKDQFEQEYQCSFEASIRGAYYGDEMQTAEEEERITAVHYDKSLEVHTSWDLGIGDSTAIWFIQLIGNEIRLIDHYETSGVGLDHYAKVLKDKPYVYGTHILPHDVMVSELGTGKSRFEMLKSLGIEPTVAPKIGVDDGIQAVRSQLNRCWFDKNKCERGVEALKLYRKSYDEKNRAFKNKPLHDWTSHSADSFRYMAVGLKPKVKYQELEMNTSWVA
jgi:phage terminase large subunit